MIARRLITDAIAAGYNIKVYDGQDILSPQKQNAKSILDLMFGVDEEFLFIYKNYTRIGWVRFIYGNEGWDVISDYSTSLGELGIMKEAEKLADEWQ